MPRPNSSGRSGKRKPSSSKSDSSKEGFSRRSSSAKSGSFKKKSSGSFRKDLSSYDDKRSGGDDRRSSKPSFRKSDSSPRKSYGAKREDGGDKKFSSRGEDKRSFKKPFKKFDNTDAPKSFRKGSGDSDKRFPSTRSDDKRSFKKPFKKFDGDDAPKSFRKKSEGSGDRRFSSSRNDGTRSFKKPFRKSDGDDASKSFRKKSDGFTEKRREPFKRPTRSFDKPASEKGDGDSRNYVRKPRSFDKPFDQEERTSNTSKKSFGKRERTPLREKADQVDAPVQTEKIRLNRFIANSGVCSRREADNLITMGLISVNGKTITELGYKVNPGDEVRYETKVLRAEKPVYVLMNKPKGFLTTTSDPQERNTVMHILGNHIKERIYPVGRLDRNTTGLLLLTNDGDLADKLMHPSYNIKKIYKVELDRPLTKADYQKILEGVHLEEGKAMVDDLAIVSDDNKTIGIELHIGWNRVVRRIFESLEYQVVKLDRSVYAGLDKKDLGRGEWRFLKKEEIVRLKHYK